MFTTMKMFARQPMDNGDQQFRGQVLELLQQGVNQLRNINLGTALWNQLVQELHETNELLKVLVKIATRPVKLTIQFRNDKGEIMPGQMTDVQSLTASIDEVDADQQPVTIDPTKITWTIGDPTVATLTPNPDGSATFKALKVGSTPVGAADSSNGLAGQDTLTITSGPATTLVLKFGTPTP